MHYGLFHFQCSPLFSFSVRCWSLFVFERKHNDGTCCFHSCGLFGTALLWKCSKMAYQQKQIKTMTNWDFNEDTKKEQQQQKTERNRTKAVQDGYKTMSRLKAYAVTSDFYLCSSSTQLNKYKWANVLNVYVYHCRGRVYLQWQNIIIVFVVKSVFYAIMDEMYLSHNTVRTWNLVESLLR